MRKEIPILFSTAMVQAIIEGRKKVTRRVVKAGFDLNGATFECLRAYNEEAVGLQAFFKHLDGKHLGTKCPYGKVGDVLWVRESFRKYFYTDEHGYTHFDDKRIDFAADNPEPIYELDGDGCQVFNKDGSEKFISFKPSIHMPKDVARIWLEVISVGVERLQEIKAADVSAEGIKYPVVAKDENCASPVFRITDSNGAIHFMPPDWQKMPDVDMGNALLYAHFAELWCEINGRESWDSNPWVWVIEFKVLSTTGKPDSIPADERSVATKLDQGKES